jgi:hypothetical protein
LRMGRHPKPFTKPAIRILADYGQIELFAPIRYN